MMKAAKLGWAGAEQEQSRSRPGEKQEQGRSMSRAGRRAEQSKAEQGRKRAGAWQDLGRS